MFYKKDVKCGDQLWLVLEVGELVAAQPERRPGVSRVAQTE